jgi:hypothetical protein
MKMDMGKYRGRELTEIPTEYFEWANIHLPMTDEMRSAVQAEHSRRLNEERIASEGAASLLLDKITHPVNRVTARAHEGLMGWIHSLSAGKKRNAG